MVRGASQQVVFESVDLEDSIVLGWVCESDDFRVSLEVSLLSDHPHADPPKPGERACFLLGELEFSEVARIDGLLPRSEVQPSKGPDGEHDYDTVHCLQTDGKGRYYLEAAFGEVLLEANPPVLRLQDSGWVCVGRMAGV